MTHHYRAWMKAAWLGALLLGGAAPLQAQPTVNWWTNTVSGFWEDSTNWLNGPPTASESVFVTNLTFPGTVTIGASTSGSHPGTMTVTNLTITNSTVDLQDAGLSVPLHILNDFDNEVGNFLQTNSLFQVDGRAIVDGEFDIWSGSALFGNMVVGNNPYGLAFLHGGTLRISPGILAMGTNAPGSYGHLGMTGGTLIHTNGVMLIGGAGSGTFEEIGGTVFAQGAQLQGVGDFTIDGGTFFASQGISIGTNGPSDNCQAVVAIGALYATNATQTGFVSVGTNSTLILSGGLLQVDNLILTNGGVFNDLGGTLIFTKAFQVANGGGVTLSNNALTTSSNFTLATSTTTANFLTVKDSAVLNITNATLGVGNDGSLTSGAGSGLVTVSNGTLNATTVNLGSTAGGQGTITLQSNGIVNVVSNFTVVSGSLSSTSTVTVASGTLSVTNGTIAIGSSGAGRMDISASVTTHRLQVGGAPGSAAGSVYLLPGGHLSSLSVSANYFLIGGGDLDSSGGDVTIGENHDAEVDVNSGSALASTMHVGFSPGFTGTYIQNGGSVVVTNSLIVGDCVSGALGVPTLNGGTLYVTNAAHNAVLDVRNGTLVLNAGAALVVDRLIITNACGHFVKHGGALTMNSPPVLGANLDADADGASNAAEAQAGTDPLDPASALVASAVVQGQNVVITWTTVGGHSYVVQTRTNLATGSFQDLSFLVSVGGTGAGTTNYTHFGGATNSTRFYRVRLGP